MIQWFLNGDNNAGKKGKNTGWWKKAREIEYPYHVPVPHTVQQHTLGWEATSHALSDARRERPRPFTTTTTPSNKKRHFKTQHREKREGKRGFSFLRSTGSVTWYNVIDLNLGLVVVILGRFHDRKMWGEWTHFWRKQSAPFPAGPSS